MLALHIWLEQVLRRIGALNRSRQLRILMIKYKFIFYWTLSSLLKLPDVIPF